MTREGAASILRFGWRNVLTHEPACAAVAQIGRLGSRSGLRWNTGDHARCSCSVRNFLEALKLASEMALMQCERAEPGEHHDGVDSFERLIADLETEVKS